MMAAKAPHQAVQHTGQAHKVTHSAHAVGKAKKKVQIRRSVKR